MKKFLIIIAVLTYLVFSSQAWAAEIEIDLQSKWQLSPTNRVTVQVALPLTGERQINSSAELVHLMGSGPTDVKLIVRASYSEMEKILYGGYYLPIKENIGLNIGVNWVQQQGEPEQNIFISGDWQTFFGQLQAGSILSTTDDKLYFQYSYLLEKPLSKKLMLQGELGAKYTQTFTQTEAGPVNQGGLIIPLTLTGVYSLNEISRVLLVFEDRFFFPEKVNDVKVRICLQTDFGKSEDVANGENPTDEVLIVEIPQPVQVVPTPGGDKSVPAGEPLPEEIPVITVSSVVSAPVLPGPAKMFEPLDPTQPIEEKPKTIPEAAAPTPENPAPGIAVKDSADKTPEPVLAGKNEQKNYYDSKASILYFKNKQYKVNCRQEQGQTLLPLREVIENLGGQVYWKDPDRQICIVLGDTKILLDLRSNVFMCNGESLLLHKELRLMDGHYYMDSGDFLEIMKFQERM